MNLTDYSKGIKAGGFVKFKRDIAAEDFIHLRACKVKSIEELKTKKFIVENVNYEFELLTLKDIIRIWSTKHFDPTI